MAGAPSSDGVVGPTRREFVAGLASALPVLSSALATQQYARGRPHPLAITMWDFSWLERRWPGAGYEDWDRVLDELKARGYDAVRIDAYPHLVAADPEREWELLPCWNQQDWGSPALNRVRVEPALTTFVRKCADRGLLVALSTWFRQDRDDIRMRIGSPAELGRIWKVTLDRLAAAKLLDRLLYVDLCNEFPLDVWAPFVPKRLARVTPEGTRWMADSIGVVRKAYPNLRYTFSFTSEYDTWRQQDVSMLDLLELHIWMAQQGGYYREVGYNYERFDSKGYENLVQRGKAVYQQDPARWQGLLRDRVAWAAEWGIASGKPLMTTECWAVVDYKDWPLLEWDWIRELCEVGVRAAVATGAWAAMATSNFCGPQFRGMWNDVAWHRRMTDLIHAGPLIESARLR